MKRMHKTSFALLLLLSVAGTSLFARQVTVQEGKDKVEVNGKKVKATSGNGASGTIAISGAGKGNETYDGNGKAITISGANHIIHITGVPTSLSVTGSNNVIYTEAALSIIVAGSNNQVRYARLMKNKKPSVSISGSDNIVMQGK